MNSVLKRLVFLSVMSTLLTQTAYADGSYSWRRRGFNDRYQCYQVDSSGRIVSLVHPDWCHQVYGYHFRWIRRGLNNVSQCAEVTPEGGFIQLAEDSACQ